MAQKLLDLAKAGPALDEGSSKIVSEAVRREVVNTGLKAVALDYRVKVSPGHGKEEVWRGEAASVDIGRQVYLEF